MQLLQWLLEQAILFHGHNCACSTLQPSIGAAADDEKKGSVVLAPMTLQMWHMCSLPAKANAHVQEAVTAMASTAGCKA